MTSERIGGWGRLAVVVGITLSIVWSGAMLYRGSEQMRLQVLAAADEAKRSCEERGEKDCSGAWMRAYFATQKRQDDTPEMFRPGFLEAFVPVLVGWLIAYGVISATRWVAEGFRLEQRTTADRPQSGQGDAGSDELKTIQEYVALAVVLLVTFPILSVGGLLDQAFGGWWIVAFIGAVIVILVVIALRR
jgi:hypothetical protein